MLRCSWPFCHKAVANMIIHIGGCSTPNSTVIHTRCLELQQCSAKTCGKAGHNSQNLPASKLLHEAQSKQGLCMSTDIQKLPWLSPCC